MEKLLQFLTASDARNAVAIAVALVTTTLAIIIYRLNRKRKALIYEFLSLTRLLSMREEIEGRVRIIVDDAEVQDVGLVQIRITNTGTEPIRAADFVRPISFTVGEGARIIEAEPSDLRPESIDAVISNEIRRATLLPTLLNSKNSLVIKLLIANFDGTITPDARIEGVELMPRLNLRDSKWMPILFRALQAVHLVTVVGGAELGLSTLSPEIHNDYKKAK
jgi:hypothetical protein